MRALCEHDLVDSSAWVTLNLPNKEGTNAGRSVQLGDHMWLAFVGCRNIAGRITASVFQLFVATHWAVRARSRDIAVKGSNTTNLQLELSRVNAVRKKCPFD